jgi:histidinol-phosphate aminotransferase
VADAQQLLTTYPEYQRLVAGLAQLWQLPHASILLTNGSDEALSVIPQTYIEPKVDRALVCLPTFAMIPHSLKLAEAVLTTVPMQVCPQTQALTYNLAAIEAALAEHPHKVAVFASPDNPTGAILPKATLESWCRRFPHTLFVLDEAYSEYQGEAFTAIPLTQELPNLLVTRTFSKAWGLAGLRLGYVVGQAHLLAPLKIVRSPYSVNTLAVSCVLALLPHAAKVQASAEATQAKRNQLAQRITQLGWPTVVGGGNFCLVQAGVLAGVLCQYLAQRGVLIRNQSHQPLLAGYVRVSTGSDGENETLLQGLEGFKHDLALVFDLDDTLVDTSQSFPKVVEALMALWSPQAPLQAGELDALRAEGGGFNDDWLATAELLRRRGVEGISLAMIQAEGQRRYQVLAPTTETLLVDEAMLASLAKRYSLYVFTGRQRAEFDPLWRDTLAPYFKRMVCSDDVAGAKPKPSPDYLCWLKETEGFNTAVYVGNNVDDMHCAKAAGYWPVGVATTQPASVLKAAGAVSVFDSPVALFEQLV